MVKIKVVYQLLERAGITDGIYDVNSDIFAKIEKFYQTDRKYVHPYGFDRIIPDLLYITSIPGLRNFLPQGEFAVIMAQRYLKRDRQLLGFRQLSEFHGHEELSEAERLRVLPEILLAEVCHYDIERTVEDVEESSPQHYFSATEERPTLAAFKRNADLAIWDVEELPRSKRLLFMLRKYRRVLDSFELQT